MIVDCHAHVASKMIFPESFRTGWRDNLASGMGDQKEARRLTALSTLIAELTTSDEDCAQLVAAMDTAGIDIAALAIADFGIAFPGDFPDLRAVYSLHHAIRTKHPGRFLLLGGMDPRRGDEGLEFFAAAIDEYAVDGLKLYPPCGFSPSHPALFPFYDLCRERDLPVLVHTGATSPSLPFHYANVELIDDAAHRFPTVNFIMAHAAFMRQDAGATLAEYRPNIYLDVTGFPNAIRMGRFEEVLQLHKRRGILHKLLFGTDWPIHRLIDTQADMVRAFAELVPKGILLPVELEMLFVGNARRLFSRLRDHD